MPKLVRQFGDFPERYDFSEVRPVRTGFLNILAFRVAGLKHRMEMMVRGSAVAVLPVDFKNRRVYMIEQPRHLRVFARHKAGKEAVDKALRCSAAPELFSAEKEIIVVTEVPAGMIDSGETPEQTAARELREETGIVVGQEALKPIRSYFPSIGGSTEELHLFLADLPDPLVWVDPAGDGTESIRVWEYSFKEAFARLEAGQVEGASSIILLQHLRIMDLENKLMRGND